MTYSTTAALLNTQQLEQQAKATEWFGPVKLAGFAPKGRNAQGKFEYLHESTGIIFVYLEGGTFMMGSPRSEADRFRDEMQHSVTLSPFLIAKYPVTQTIWQRVKGNNPSSFKGNPERPVERVSWYEATDFCSKSELVLPSEAQWEFACRAGTIDPYAGSLDELGWHSANSEKTTHPVGMKRPNAWGLFDMHGNVWEWCNDWYGDYSAVESSDPRGLDRGSDRVRRGGSWCIDARLCRSAFRFRCVPDGRNSDLGFRPSKFLSIGS